MPSPRWSTPALALPLLLVGCSGPAASRSPGVLPLRSLRLYESGVGYFERSGTLEGPSTSLPVPAGQLDDALKSLVVVGHRAGGADGAAGADGKRGASYVDAVEFPSSVGRGMARALAGLPRDASTPVAYGELLGSLRGGRVAVRTTKRGELVGRVIEIVPDPPLPDADGVKTPPAPLFPGDTFTLLLLGDGGQLDRIRASDIETVRALDPAFASHLEAALDALAPHGTHGRALEVFAHASGPVTLGYVAEAPVYRTTYRLVLADAESHTKSLLQGWALVHNDTEESWRGVRVELANGRPDSFIVPLAVPRYDRRTLVAPERALSTVPQLLDSTADSIWGDNVDDSSASGEMGSGYGSGGGGVGSGHGRLGGSHVTRSAVVRSDDLEVGNLAQVAEASGVETGALFVYTLAQLLDLGAHASALVPFLQRPLTVHEITWLAGFDAAPRAAARVVNDSNQTIPEGPISFFAHGGFAGEAKLGRLKPGTRSFIDYGDELDVIVTRQAPSSHETPKHVAFVGGNLVEHFLQTTEWTYQLENRSGRAKTLCAELPIVSNATVEGADSLDYDTRSEKPVAVFSLAANKRSERHVKVVEGLARSTPPSAFHAEQLDELAASLAGDEGRAIADVAHRQADLDQATAKEKGLEQAIATAEKDVERWRETLKAAGGEGEHGASAALVQRVVRLEDQLTTLRKQLEAQRTDHGTKDRALHAALQKLPPG